MGAYDTSAEECPYCGNGCQADFVDNGIGMIQCGPYHCFLCGASEIGPELFDWYLKDREGEIIHMPKQVFSEKVNEMIITYGHPVLKPDAPFTTNELNTGFYNPNGREKATLSPYANTINGELVDHKQAKEAYNVGLLDEKNI